MEDARRCAVRAIYSGAGRASACLLSVATALALALALALAVALALALALALTLAALAEATAEATTLTAAITHIYSAVSVVRSGTHATRLDGVEAIHVIDQKVPQSAVPRCAWGGGLDTAATRRQKGEPTLHLCRGVSTF